jgi:hypothetical protein
MTRIEADLSALLDNKKVVMRAPEGLSRYFRTEIARDAVVLYSA